jgi:hypothetical protein
MGIQIFIASDLSTINLFISKLASPKKQVINLAFSPDNNIVLFYWIEP